MRQHIRQYASIIFVLVLLLSIFLVIRVFHVSVFPTLISFIFLLLTLFLIIHSLFNTFLLIYAWEDPEKLEKNKSPKEYKPPAYTFTAIVPARHEVNVIKQTIQALARIKYPEKFMEMLVVCRYDDKRTIAAVEQTIQALGKQNIKLIIFYDTPINKPHALNIGLQYAEKDIVVIFDAEDEPHPDIYNVANTVFLNDQTDVLQSGVQLMNYRSNWFSGLNVLEYFFWFKSSLQFFSRQGLIPLGGNSVFFKKSLLNKIGGWDERCLTEDADVGIRLSIQKAKIRVVYDESHATREETPTTIKSFIKQRTRWNQGFLQILLKGEWLQLPSLKHKLLALYVLAMPEIELLFFGSIPFSIFVLLTVKMPVLLALLSILPLLFLILQFVIYNVGMYEFTRDYNLPYTLLIPLTLLFSFYPYQLILAFSSIRSIARLLKKNITWEKTHHINAHRIIDDFMIPYFPLAIDKYA